MIWVHDGSLDGLLCAVRQVRSAPDGSFTLVPRQAWQPSLFEESRSVVTDRTAARALAGEIRTRLPGAFWKTLVFAHLSCRDGLDTPIAEFIRLGFSMGARTLTYHAHPAVEAVTGAARATGGELHRLKGLLRFRELREGVFWAPCEPEACILVPLALHFRRRMPAVVWAIQDMGRGQTALWDGGRLRVETTETTGDLSGGGDDTASEREQEMQHLWKTYFRSVAITNRRNPRLQRKNMPQRYWKWLVEAPAGR